MRRWWPPGLAAAVTVGAVLWWLWPAAHDPLTVTGSPTPEAWKQSSWNAPIPVRGKEKLRGVVLRDGKPVAGAMITAVAAHGEDVLSDLPCGDDQGEMLLACGCAEAAGQLVELVAARTGESVPLARASTDALGAFTLNGLEEGTVTLFADAPDGVGWLANVASDAQDAQVLLEAGRTIQGKVITSDGKPAKGALVTAIFAAHSRFFDVVADEKGEFRLGPLPRGKYAVVAMLGGLVPDHQQVGEDETKALTLELSVPRSVSGVVLLEERPVAGATVKLEGMHRKRTVVTDVKGQFRVERLRPGEYELAVESPQGPGAASVLIGKHEDRTDVTIALTPGAPLEGLVMTESGAPVPAARVFLLVGKKWKHTESDTRGAFRFEGVSTDEHQVYARKEGLLDVRVKARGGQSGVVLRMLPSAVLSGLVRSSTGELVLEYSIRATALDGGKEDQHHVREKSVDGGFALEVWPGAYELEVEAPPLAKMSMKASAPAAGLVFVMKPGEPIEGAEVMGVQTGRDGGSKQAAPIGATTDSQGRFRLHSLQAGDVIILVELKRETS